MISKDKPCARHTHHPTDQNFQLGELTVSDFVQ